MPVCDEIEVYFPEVSTFGSVPPKQIEKLQGSVSKLDSRVSKIEGRLEVPPREKESANPTTGYIVNAAFTAFVLYLAWIGWQIHQQGKDLSQLTATLSGPNGISETLKKHDERITTIESSGQLERAASTPTSPQNQTTARNILSEAKQGAVTLPETVVRDAGRRFIEAAQTDPKAWDVALDFVSYRSSLNVGLRPTVTTPLKPDATHYRLGPPILGKSPPAAFIPLTGVPYDRSARYENIGQELNPDVRVGNAFLLLRGGTLSIDGKTIRNVIFEGVEILYSGKPLVLEGVIFINCKFAITNTAPSRRFGETVLASSRVNFQS